MKVLRTILKYILLPSLKSSEGNSGLTECQFALSGRSRSLLRRAVGRGVGPLLLLLLLSSCKPELPSGVLSESELESVLYDFHVAQGISELQSARNGKSLEAERYELHQAVFRKHDITEAEFDTTMAFYCSDLERLNRVYEHLVLRLERDAEALGAATATPDLYATMGGEGDTANVWAGKKIFAVRNRLHENLQSWQQACDSTWLPGDDILWRFQTSLYAREQVYLMYATIVVTYTNDSVRSKTQIGTVRSLSELRVNDSEGWTPRTVSGFYYLPVEDDPQKMRLMIIDRLALVRFHKSQAWRDEKAGKQVQADTLAADTVKQQEATPAHKDSIIHRPAPDEHRLSPSELRERQPVDRKIEVVKEKPYQVRKRGRRK